MQVPQNDTPHQRMEESLQTFQTIFSLYGQKTHEKTPRNSFLYLKDKPSKPEKNAALLLCSSQVSIVIEQ